MFYGYPFLGKGFGKPFGWPASKASGGGYAVPATTVITSPYPI
jgi:hypothetical protein